MPIACHMFTYTLKDSARIWWNGQKAGSIVNYEDLKAKFRSHFSQQKKFTKTHFAVHNIKQKDSLVKFLSTDLPTTYKGLTEKTYTWIEEKEVATNGAPNDHKEGFDKFNKGFSWDNSKVKKKNREREGGQNLQRPPRMVKNRRSCDMSEYCHFHEDHKHETNQCRELRHQIEEAVKSGQLTHLVKGIKKGKAKASDTQLGEWKKGDTDIIPVKALILMISRESQASKRKYAEGPVNVIGAHLPPVAGFDKSSGPIIITV
ncbi:reverse transcriptase domain-containing protein [Tanacetum coccineum]